MFDVKIVVDVLIGLGIWHVANWIIGPWIRNFVTTQGLKL